MGLGATIVVLLLAMAAAVLANWRERRPQAAGEPPLVPYTAIQILAVVIVVLMLAHLVSLLTGQELTGRFLR